MDKTLYLHVQVLHNSGQRIILYRDAWDAGYQVGEALAASGLDGRALYPINGWMSMFVQDGNGTLVSIQSGHHQLLLFYCTKEAGLTTGLTVSQMQDFYEGMIDGWEGQI